MASVALLAGCAAPTDPADSSPSPPTLRDAAEAGALLPLTLAPGLALSAARAWEADTAAACPTRETVGEVLTLSGGCTTADGAALTGSVSRDTAPDGGGWTFAALGVARGAARTTWSGSVVWVQTDGANDIAGYDFVAAAAAAGTARWDSFAGHLDDASRNTRALASGVLLPDAAADGTATTLPAAGLAVAVTGDWAWGDCATAPTAGALRWTAGADTVTATFDGVACGACVPWEGGDGAAGTWCPD